MTVWNWSEQRATYNLQNAFLFARGVSQNQMVSEWVAKSIIFMVIDGGKRRITSGLFWTCHKSSRIFLNSCYLSSQNILTLVAFKGQNRSSVSHDEVETRQKFFLCSSSCSSSRSVLIWFSGLKSMHQNQCFMWRLIFSSLPLQHRCCWFADSGSSMASAPNCNPILFRRHAMPRAIKLRKKHTKLRRRRRHQEESTNFWVDDKQRRCWLWWWWWRRWLTQENLCQIPFTRAILGDRSRGTVCSYFCFKYSSKKSFHSSRWFALGN